MRRRSPAIAIAVLVLSAGAARGGIELAGAERLPIDRSATALATADLNGDGRDDVLAVDGAGGGLRTFVATAGAARLAPADAHQLVAPLGRLATGDLDGDGRLDVAVAGRRQGVWVLLGNGDGTLAAPVAVGRVGDALDVDIADVDGGGADLLVADAAGRRVAVLLQLRARPPAFRLGALVDLGGVPRRVLAADADGDGYRDIVAVAGGTRVDELTVHRFRRLAQSLPEYQTRWRATAIDGEVADLVAAEVNGDGAPDLVVRDARAGRLLVLLDAADRFAVSALAVPCPFFTGGLPCPLRGLAVADVNRDNRADLLIALHDPRPTGGAAAPADAVQVWAGRGDGRFVAGPVAAVGRGAGPLVAGQHTDDCLPDVVIASGEPAVLQVLENRSRPGGRLLGEPCLAGDECLSATCADGRCCATPCAGGQRCDHPGAEGHCRPEPPATVPCTADATCAAVPGQPYCADGVCCDDRCTGGRCDRDGFAGLCIPGLADGAPCAHDRACASGFCADNRRCCREPCDGGYCDAGGACRALRALAAPCEADEQCASAVCDEFDRICCARRCEFYCQVDGRCAPEPIATPLSAAPPPARRAARAARCTADCDGDGAVGVAEVVRLVNLALGRAVPACGSHAAGRRCVAIDDVIGAIAAALAGCR